MVIYYLTKYETIESEILILALACWIMACNCCVSIGSIIDALIYCYYY
jgi:hypothetical protein